MRYWLFLAFTCFLHITAQAQTGNISGTITDNKGKAVSGATVSFQNFDKTVATDENGRYEFRNIKFGSYTLEVSSIITERRTINIKLNRADETFNITVKEKGKVELQEIVVVGKSEKRVIEEKGFAVNVISTERAALQSIQTNELLDRSAGVRIRQDGGLGSHIHYNINGLTGNAIKIFIDGVPISNYGSSYSLNSIPPALIERIEVYKGVVPANLSEDALGGAINVILKNSKKNSFSTAYSFGSFNTHQWNSSGTYKNAKNGLTVNASGFYNYSDNNYEVWGEDIYKTNFNGNTTPIRAKRFHDGYKSAGGRFDIGFTNVKWADQFSVGTIISGADKDVQHGAIMRIVYGNRTTNQNSIVNSLQYSKKNLVIKGLDVNINGSYSFLNRGVTDTVADRYTWDGSKILDRNGNVAQWSQGAEQGTPTLSINKENNLVLRANLSYAINQNNKIFTNLFYNSFVRDADDEVRPLAERLLDNTRNLEKNVFGLTYENLSFRNRLRTNIFYKYFKQNHESIRPYWQGAQGTGTLLSETINRSADASGYGLALSYELFSKFFLMASGENAVRMPDASELFGNEAENIFSSANLNPETSKNGNFGINAGPFVAGKNTVSVNSNFFFRQTKDMIRLNIQTNKLDETGNYENFESIESHGFDAEVTYNYNNKLNVLFTISKFNSKWNVEYNQNGERYPQYNSQLANEPNFKFNSTVSYYFKDLLQKKSNAAFHYNALYVREFLRNFSGFGGANLAMVPKQFVHDLGFTYTLPSRKVTFGIDAKNITNEQVFDNYALQKPGRAFYGKITYTLF